MHSCVVFGIVVFYSHSDCSTHGYSPGFGSMVPQALVNLRDDGIDGDRVGYELLCNVSKDWLLYWPYFICISFEKPLCTWKI